MRGRREGRDNRRGFYRNKLIATMIIVMGTVISINSADNKTEFGVMDDFTVWGVEGTLADPDLEIKGFSVFGATQTAYTANIVNGPGNVMINGVLGVSSGAYIAGISTISYIANINTTSMTITGNGITGSSVIFKVANSTMVILNDGRVGIGTMNPDHKLDVNGNFHLSGGTNRIIKMDTSSAWYYYLATDSNNFKIYDYDNTDFLKLYYGSGGATKYSSILGALNVINSGNVGIGTTDPSAKLSVQGSGISYSLFVSTDSAGSVGNLVVNNSGNVGIGTTNPGYKLTVSNGGIGGNYGLLPNYANWSIYGTGDGGAAIYNDNGSYKKLMIVGNTAAGGIREIGMWDNVSINGNLTVSGSINNTTLTGNVNFPGSGIWNSSGNVGIGTTDPKAKLEVNGVIKAQNDYPIRQQMVNRRIIFGYAGDSGLDYSNTWTTVRSSVYGPFCYAVPSVQSGATRKYRLYAIYSDNMTTSGSNQIWFDMTDGSDYYFNLPLTWGGISSENRDAYSNWYTGQPSCSHGVVKIQTTISALGKLWYMELQAWDFFE